MHSLLEIKTNEHPSKLVSQQNELKIKYLNKSKLIKHNIKKPDS